jgi:hypothetical protein
MSGFSSLHLFHAFIPCASILRCSLFAITRLTVKKDSEINARCILPLHNFANSSSGCWGEDSAHKKNGRKASKADAPILFSLCDRKVITREANLISLRADVIYSGLIDVRIGLSKKKL